MNDKGEMSMQAFPVLFLLFPTKFPLKLVFFCLFVCFETKKNYGTLHEFACHPCVNLVQGSVSEPCVFKI